MSFVKLMVDRSQKWPRRTHNEAVLDPTERTQVIPNSWDLERISENMQQSGVLYLANSSHRNQLVR